MNTDVQEFLASFPFAEMTKDSYGRVLVQLVELELEVLTAAGLLAFVSRPEWGSSMRYTALCACRRFVGWKYGPGHPALSARVKRGASRRQRVLSADLALQLLASFDTSQAKGARDLSLAALALDTGLRCSELCRLALADVELDRRVLQVIVKGGQWGSAVFSAQTALYLADWLVLRRPAPGVVTLFVSTRGGEALTREGLKVIVRDWGRVVGVKLSPHDFRRSFATLSTIFGAPSRVVQVAGRWSNILMVEHYTRDLQAREIEPYLPMARLGK
jgi:integrase